ncbi:hypothetical protein MKQ68_21820 [Chitinophaga horti]|uniref:Lipoprotein n=1 Tax=Chitinophaga horti TaxID=2920382 RepID=A0ABY6IZB7_9BACT|nr:hypothetical protein [Chitinophaga horti]UYQ92720.1 hypothetical protein MKQ68_21820 [Chitinophaga horti]
MINLTRIAISALLLVSVASCQQNSSCKVVSLEGKNAIDAILASDTIIPNTMLILPDSIVTSSDKKITNVLDTLRDRGLLQYVALDSFRSTRRLTGPQLDGPDDIMLYRYAISWAPGIKQNGRYHDVLSVSFLGRELQGEVRYSGREVRIGKVSIMEDDTLFFHQDCEKQSFRYAYKLEPCCELGEAIGFNAYERIIRRRTGSEPAEQIKSPAIEVAGQ